MFKKLKSLFIIEEGVPNKPKVVVQDSPKTTSQASKGNSIVKTTTTPLPPPNVTNKSDVTGEINEKFLNILFEALEKNNLEGFDYLEFKKSLQSLSVMPMDEATRFKSAFAMANSMNVTTDQLLQSADFYISILIQEEQKFENALAQQKSTKVHAQEEQVLQLEKTVAAKTEQIKLLTQEIDTLQQQITTTSAEIMDQTVKAEKTKNDFNVSYNAVVGQIKADVENMKKYLIVGLSKNE